jgi:prepilin-type N-terminal cleavage/methylation domain-containing protein
VRKNQKPIGIGLAEPEQNAKPSSKEVSLKVFMKAKGFALIEILIALIILSISLLALASLMAMTTQNNSTGSHLTEAVTYAQDKLEELRVMSWGSVPVGTNGDQKPGSTGINYSRNWNVVQSGTLKTITITVSWNDRTNHSIRIVSVVAQ